jgi:pseudaminic acid biosynthesis-associated methylase
MEYGARAFQRILQNYKFNSILEVGSNIGLNLRFIYHNSGDAVKYYALEPNEKAFRILTSQDLGFKLEQAFNCDAFNVPLPDNSIDLVFTAGVLIHIHPDDLLKAMGEIVRVSKRYVLCIEYFSHKPEEIPYQGRNGLLFKRDFGKMYAENFPNLQWRDYGFLWQVEFPIFDDMNWWIFEKTNN